MKVKGFDVDPDLSVSWDMDLEEKTGILRELIYEYLGN